MSGRTPTTSASSKDASRQIVEVRAATSPSVGSPTVPALKLTIIKQPPKEAKEMSPEPERAELLGSLTTQQQQRTSARVIKKLQLEPLDKKKRSDADDAPECDTPNKAEDKELKFPTVKQRMPKALWSTDEKNLFFEALNEYGKDFDAVTSHICAKMKKKGMPDGNLKTKTQVSHFYYRTWHKLSKHVRFGENVKKVAQELYALINYGELRKKLVSVNEKICGRLGEMVLGGSIMVRARGRNVRVRTPMCRALRRLNQISERACSSRVCTYAMVSLHARDAAGWARVQAAAHNPRAAAVAPPHTKLAAFIAALARRWRPISNYKHKESDDEDTQTRRDNGGNHLNLETDQLIVREKSKKLSLHVGPRPEAEIHLPVVRVSEQLSSQKICFSSYLERMGERLRREGSKIRTPKRQRKDSTTEKDKEVEQKKMKLDEESIKLINIEETAIDGIELMASYKNNIEDERPSTEDEKENNDDLKTCIEEDPDQEIKEDLQKDDKIDREESGKEKEMSEREKDSFSEMEDDEKYVKSDSDNESDSGKIKERKFKNLKVKFRIRQKKRGGSEYTVVTDKQCKEDCKEDCKDECKGECKEQCKEECNKAEEREEANVQLALRQIRKGWSVTDAGELTLGDLYLMFGNRSKLELDYWWTEPTPPLPQTIKLTETIDKDRDKTKTDKEKTDKIDKNKLEKIEKKIEKERPDKAEKTDSSLEDDKTDKEELFSPKSQDSNDGSGDERKSEFKNKYHNKLNDQTVSPEHKCGSGTLQVMSKLVNNPVSRQQPEGFSLLSERLKRLLSAAGNPLTSKVRACIPCTPHSVKRVSRPTMPILRPALPTDVFRHPTPIAPRGDTECSGELELSGVPRTRRGRPRVPQQRVVVQRLLPLLPKLHHHAPLIPVKLVPNAPPAPPRILPKPPPTSTSDLSFFYVLSESNGQFFFHDGDRRIPITQATANGPDTDSIEDEMKSEELSSINEGSAITIEVPPLEPSSLTIEVPPLEGPSEGCKGSEGLKGTVKMEKNVKSEKTEKDIGNFLGTESMSLSPSRLLREAEGWLDSSVHDFSLSSFLQHLEPHEQPDTAVDSHLHSLMAESSVDYVAKFADLAAEVTDGTDALPSNNLT